MAQTPRRLPPAPVDTKRARAEAFAFYMEALRADGVYAGEPVERVGMKIAQAAGLDFTLYLRRPLEERLGLARSYATTIAAAAVDRVAGIAEDAIRNFAEGILGGRRKR